MQIESPVLGKGSGGGTSRVTGDKRSSRLPSGNRGSSTTKHKQRNTVPDKIVGDFTMKLLLAQKVDQDLSLLEEIKDESHNENLENIRDSDFNLGDKN